LSEMAPSAGWRDIVTASAWFIKATSHPAMPDTWEALVGRWRI
jgi:hypothetical protein